MSERRPNGLGVVVVIGLIGLFGCGGGGKAASTNATLVSAVSSGAVVGAQGSLQLVFDNPVPSDISVKLVSLTPSVAKVPDTVTVKQGTLRATIAFDALALGSSTITATAGMATVTTTASVVDEIRISSLYTTNAEVGAPALLDVYLNITPAAATDVTLSVADASIATVPASVHFAPFDYYASGGINYVAVGTTAITATLGMSMLTSTVTVVDHARLSSVSSTAKVEKGGTFSISANVDAIVAAATPITIASSNPATFALPALTIQPGNTSATATLTATTTGETDLTYTLKDSKRSTHVSVVDAGTLTSVSATSSLLVGQSGTLNVGLDTTAVASHDVMLTSSDPTVLALPAKLTIQPGGSTAELSFVALKAGASAITGTFNGVSVQQLVIVTDASTPTASSPYVYLSGPTALQVGALTSAEVSAYDENGSETYKDVTVTSSDPTVLAVPATVSVYYSAAIPLQGLKAGKATLSVSAFGITRTLSVLVVTTASISEIAPVGLDVGAQTTATAYLTAVPPLGTAVTLKSNQPTFATVPDTVYVTGTDASIQIPVTGVATGTAIVTATLGGSSASFVVYVGISTAATIAPYLSGLQLTPNNLVMGATSTLTGTIGGQAFPADMPITIAFMPTGVLSLVDSTTVLHAGETTFAFPVTAIAPGTTTATVTVNGVALTASATAVATATFDISGPTSLTVGYPGTIYVSASSALTAEAAVTLSSSDPTIVTITDAAGTIAPGTASAEATFGIYAKAAGTATITATVGGKMLTTMVKVVAP